MSQADARRAAVQQPHADHALQLRQRLATGAVAAKAGPYGFFFLGVFGGRLTPGSELCLYACSRYNRHMSRRAQLKRKSFFIDEATLREAKRALSVESDAEAVRLSLEQVAEMDRFWRFMDKSKGKLKPGSFGDV